MPAFLAEPRLKDNAFQISLARCILISCASAQPTIPQSELAMTQAQIREMPYQEVASALEQNPNAKAELSQINTRRLRSKFIQDFKDLGFDYKTIQTFWGMFQCGIERQRELSSLSGGGNNRTGPGTKYRNEIYAKIAATCASKGILSSRKKMALWSGGYEVSEYAQKLGYTCLESTQLGAMIQRGKYYHHERDLFRLWNYLSEEFVNQVTGTDVHVFCRNFDRNSVLLQIEYPRLLQLMKEKGKTFNFCWHVLVGDSPNPSDLRTLCADGTLVNEAVEGESYFRNPLHAELAMREFYKNMSKDERKNYKYRQQILEASYGFKARSLVWKAVDRSTSFRGLAFAVMATQRG